MANVVITGLKEYEKALRALPRELKGSSSAEGILAFATRKAMNLVKDAARAAVPVDTGKLRDSLKVTKNSGTNYAATMEVGRYLPRYWHIVEFGDSGAKVGGSYKSASVGGKAGLNRRHLGRDPTVLMSLETGKVFGTRRKRNIARSYIRTAWQQKGEEALREQARQIANKLARVMKKLRSK